MRRQVGNHWFLGAAAAALLGAPALAAEQAPTGLEEVVVTARRTAESAQSVPLSLTALSAQTLRAANVTSVADLQRLAPGISVSAGLGGASTVAVSIRGQSPSDSLLTTDPAVGIYLDDVVMPRGVGLRPAQFDLASMQVLEGPQGTLFGKNTTGGAILITTQRPKAGLGGYLDAQASSYNGEHLAGAVNVPLAGDRLALRVAGLLSKHDGFGRDVRGQPVSDENLRSVRASILWAPADHLEILASYDDSRARQHAPNNRLLYVNGCTAPGVCSGVPLPSLLGGPLPRFDANGAPIPGVYGLGYSSTVFNEIVAERGLTATPANLSAAQTLLSTFLPGGANDPGFYNFAGAWADNHDNLDASGASLQVKLDLGPLTLRSITGLRRYERDSANPYTPFREPGPPTSFTEPNGVVIPHFTMVGGFLQTHTRSITQELQLQKQTGHGLDYTAGLFWQDEQGVDGGPAVTVPALSPAAAPTINDGAITNRSTSAYAQVVYHLTDRLRVTGGLRYTQDEKAITSHNGNGTGPHLSTGIINAVANPALAPQAQAALLNPGENCSLDPTLLPAGAQPYLMVVLPSGTRSFFARTPDICSVSRKARFNSTNWLLSADWRPTDDLMVYGKVSTGYKGGGFNLRLTNPAGLLPFDAETTLEYEVGLKADWLDRRLRTNFAAYYTNYDNIQRSEVVAVLVNGALRSASVVANAARAHVYGGEASVTAAPVEGLTLNLAASYVRGAYDSFRPAAAVDPATGAPIAFNNLTGLAFPFPTTADVPRLRYTATADYRRDTGLGLLQLNVNWAWRSDQPVPNTPGAAFAQIKAYGLLGARASLTVPAWGDAEVSVFVRNALNRKYFTTAQYFDTVWGYNIGFTGEPRIIGVGIEKRFGGG